MMFHVYEGEHVSLKDSAGNSDTATLILDFIDDIFPPMFDETYYRTQIEDPDLARGSILQNEFWSPIFI